MLWLDLLVAEKIRKWWCWGVEIEKKKFSKKISKNCENCLFCIFDEFVWIPTCLDFFFSLFEYLIGFFFMKGAEYDTKQAEKHAEKWKKMAKNGYY